MDMLGFLRLRAWDARRDHEKKKPRQRFIDEVWPGLKPGCLLYGFSDTHFLSPIRCITIIDPIFIERSDKPIFHMNETDSAKIAAKQNPERYQQECLR